MRVLCLIRPSSVQARRALHRLVHLHSGTVRRRMKSNCPSSASRSMPRESQVHSSCHPTVISSPSGKLSSKSLYYVLSMTEREHSHFSQAGLKTSVRNVFNTWPVPSTKSLPSDLSILTIGRSRDQLPYSLPIESAPSGSQLLGVRSDLQALLREVLRRV